MPKKLKKKTPLERYIDQLIEFFQPRMSLNLYDVSYKMLKHIGRARGAYIIAPEPDGFASGVVIDFVYYEIKISFNKTKLEKKWRDMDFFYIASTVVHELAHTYTEQLYHEYWQALKKKSKLEREHMRQVNESTVEKITKVILSNHRQEDWMPKNYA
jgi:hypothetical protein